MTGVGRCNVNQTHGMKREYSEGVRKIKGLKVEGKEVEEDQRRNVLL